MTLCPGRKGPSLNGDDWDRDLNADVTAMKVWGADIVVSLTEEAEMRQLGMHDLDSALQDAGISWLHMPIPDVSTPGPGWDERWRAASPEIHRNLDTGGKVIIHCKAGLERTALVAAILQREHGVTLDTALSIIANTRPGAGPTPGQLRWLQSRLAEGCD